MARRSEFLPKTHAKSVFCLADKDIEPLQAVEKRNPRSRNGPPMRLYGRTQLEAVAHRKWGGPEGLAAEQRKREERRSARSATAAFAAAATAIATAAATAGVGAGGPPAAPHVHAGSAAAPAEVAWLGLSPLVSERIRQVVPWTPAPGLIAAMPAAQPAAAAVLSPSPSPSPPAKPGLPGAVAALAGGADEDDAGPSAYSFEEGREALLVAEAVRPGQGMPRGTPAGSERQRGRDGERGVVGVGVEMVDLVDSSEEEREEEQEEGGVGGQQGCAKGPCQGPGATCHQRHQRHQQRRGSNGSGGGGGCRVSGGGSGGGWPGAAGVAGTAVRGEPEDEAIVILSSDDGDDDGDEEDVEEDDDEGYGGRGAVVDGCPGPQICGHARAQQHQRQHQHHQPGKRKREHSTTAPAVLLHPPPAAEGAAEGTAGSSPAAVPGEYVLYWMKTAVRGHENPALDAARAAAERLRLPLLVAAFVLPACQPYANHRRVKFVLEGLCDAQRELREQGLDLLVHMNGAAAPTSPGRMAAAEETLGAQGASDAAAAVVAGSGSAGGRADCLDCGVSAAAAGGCGAGQHGRSFEASSIGGPRCMVEPSGPGWAALLSAARRAALVVTEDMPVDPDSAWLAALVRQLELDREAGDGSAAGPLPGVWAVDTACIVPMRLVARAYDRAYAYRGATEGLRRQRLRAVYAAGAAGSSRPSNGPMGHFLAPNAGAAAAAAAAEAAAAMDIDTEGTGASRAAVLGGVSSLSSGGGGGAGGVLGWHSLDLQAPGLDLGALAASLPGVDQSVRGVSHMLGGSRAGYARWDSWRRGGGVGRYAATRNNALKRSGTSRLSAYLHWGMVSPFRIAREAAASGGSGSSKFLDEMLVWRELSYSFCYHRYQLLESLSVLPRWAQDTLAAHAGDPRVTKTLQQLETGTTGDAFWDAAQRQLATHGELHNNVRMTWGKALLGWCSSPQQALATTLHLNHRYALDGCDPASYGGILWCFGLFDGPKDPAATPVSGSLRRRPTGSHARRMDPVSYAALPA